MSFKTATRTLILSILRWSSLYRRYSYLPKGPVGIECLKDIEVICQSNYEQLERPAPSTLDQPVYWKFVRSFQEQPPSTFVIRAKNYRVWGNQGAVITSGGALFHAVSREFEKPDHTIYKQFKLIAPTRLTGRSLVLAASGGDMYYHWMVDILPRLKLLQDVGEYQDVDHYIIPFHNLPFQVETLKMLNVDTRKISPSNDHFGYHVLTEELIIPSLPSRLDVVAPWVCQFLADTFLGHPVDTGIKKIYLKRTGKRSLINGPEIESFLIAQGFTTIECEGHTIAEQARLFHYADVIVGPHGAAFTNTVFCRPGTKVLEFFSPLWINPCYWTISTALSLTYHYLVGEGPPPARISDARGTNVDIQVDIQKLKALFGQFDL